MKKCSRCKKTKNLYLFQKRKVSKDGYSPHCKECASVYESKRSDQRIRKPRSDRFSRGITILMLRKEIDEKTLSIKNVKFIKINQSTFILVSGVNVLIDDVNIDLLQRFSWSINSKGYAVTYYKGRTFKMHRIVLGVYEQTNIVDHINCNKLDNRSSNLRVCNISQNSKNTSKIRGKVNYKGVSIRGKRYIARITNNGEMFYKMFDKAVDAALWYDKMAIKHHGEFAKTNAMIGSTIKEVL